MFGTGLSRISSDQIQLHSSTPEELNQGHLQLVECVGQEPLKVNSGGTAVEFGTPTISSVQICLVSTLDKWYN